MCATELSAREPGRKARPGEETGPCGTAKRDGAGSAAPRGPRLTCPARRHREAALGERGRRWAPGGARAGGGGDRGEERGGSVPSLTR